MRKCKDEIRENVINRIFEWHDRVETRKDTYSRNRCGGIGCFSSVHDIRSGDPTIIFRGVTLPLHQTLFDTLSSSTFEHLFNKIKRTILRDRGRA